MNVRITYALLLCAGTALVQAQVTVDRAVILNGTTDSTRQVLGLPDSQTPGDLLGAGTEQAGAFRTANPVAGPVWAVELAALEAVPEAGMHIQVRTPASTPGPVSVLVNGHGPFDLTWDGATQLEGEQVPEGSMLSLVHDGEGFQVMNGFAHVRKSCPTGTVAVNEHFCIQPQENTPSTTFFDAILICAQSGLRLCSWAEFVVACENRVELDIPDLVGNWEWTRSSAGSNRVVRMVGSQNCTSASTASTNEGNPLRRFHCCASR